MIVGELPMSFGSLSLINFLLPFIRLYVAIKQQWRQRHGSAKLYRFTVLSSDEVNTQASNLRQNKLNISLIII